LERHAALLERAYARHKTDTGPHRGRRCLRHAELREDHRARGSLASSL